MFCPAFTLLSHWWYPFSEAPPDSQDAFFSLWGAALGRSWAAVLAERWSDSHDELIFLDTVSWLLLIVGRCPLQLG